VTPLAALIMLGGLLGVGNAQVSDQGDRAPIPAACAALEDSGATGALGPAVAFKSSAGVDTAALRLDQCRASAPSGTPSLVLMIRQIDSAQSRTVSAQMERFAAAEGRGRPYERLDHGDGALWFPDLGRLAVWHRGGATRFVLTAAGENPRELAEQAAQALLAAYP